MTVTYTLSVSEARFWGFPRLLARWKGSIYRLMYREMLAFLFAYYFLAILYRYAFNAELQRWHIGWFLLEWLIFKMFLGGLKASLVTVTDSPKLYPSLLFWAFTLLLLLVVGGISTNLYVETCFMVDISKFKLKYFWVFSNTKRDFILDIQENFHF